MIGRVLGAAGALGEGVLMNAAYFLSGFFPRDKGLWLFGAWEGKMYRDSARSLFEHLVSDGKSGGRRVFWITRSSAVAAGLREKGLPVAEASGWEAWRLCLRAGVIFVTHGRHDVVKFLTRGARVIFLNHSTPIKHMGYDARSIAYYHPTRLQKALYGLIDPYWNIKFDRLLSASEQTAPIVCSSYRVAPERVWPIGLPRFVALAAAAKSPRARSGPRKVLYMPTFRDREGFSHFAFGFDLAEMERRLRAMGAELLVALHPFDRSPVPAQLSDPGREGPVRLHSPPDVNELLPGIDVLVTDFSSVAFDFLLLDRPMVFTQFDFEDFIATQRGTYFEYDSMTPGPKARDWPAVLDLLEEVLARGVDRCAPLRTEVRRRFFREDYSGVHGALLERVERLLSEED